MADNISITIDAKELINNLDGVSEKAVTALTTIGNMSAENMKAYAKEHGVWIDRTGDARRYLDAKCEWQGEVLDISVYHVMDYGLWLELCNAGRYAILQEARDTEIANFKSAIKNLNL